MELKFRNSSWAESAAAGRLHKSCGLLQAGPKHGRWAGSLAGPHVGRSPTQRHATRCAGAAALCQGGGGGDKVGVHSPAEVGQADSLELGYGGTQQRAPERKGPLGGPQLRLETAKLGGGQHAVAPSRCVGSATTDCSRRRVPTAAHSDSGRRARGPGSGDRGSVRAVGALLDGENNGELRQSYNDEEKGFGTRRGTKPREREMGRRLTGRKTQRPSIFR
jgi:hypothetical protein